MKCKRNVDIEAPDPDEWMESALDDSDRLKDEFRERIDEMDGDINDPVARSEAIHWLAGEYGSVYDGVKESLEQLVSSDRPRIYREMSVSDVDAFIDQLRKHGKTFRGSSLEGLGTSWADVKDAARGVWARDEPCKIIITARVLDLQDIDFKLTWKLSLIYVAEQEREIKMREGSRILVERIELSSSYWKTTRDESCKPSREVFDGLDIPAFT